MRTAPTHPAPVTPWPFAIVDTPAPALREAAPDFVPMRMTTAEACKRSEDAASVHEASQFWAASTAVATDERGVWWFAAWCMVSCLVVRMPSIEPARGLIVEFFATWLTNILKFPIDGMVTTVAALRDPSLTEVAGVRVNARQLVKLLDGLDGPVIVHKIAYQNREALWITATDGAWRAGVTRWDGALPNDNESAAKGGA